MTMNTKEYNIHSIKKQIKEICKKKGTSKSIPKVNKQI